MSDSHLQNVIDRDLDYFGSDAAVAKYGDPSLEVALAAEKADREAHPQGPPVTTDREAETDG